MLRLALVFLIVSLIAGLFGFWGISGVSYDFAKVLFFIFVVLFAISLIFGLARRGDSTLPPV